MPKLEDISVKKRLPICNCGKQLSRPEYTKCKPCFAKERKGIPQKENITYYGWHIYIRRMYGSADHCENKQCLGDSHTFEWSLLKGKEYSRNRRDYWQLCKKCHNLYDKIYDGRKRNARGLFI